MGKQQRSPRRGLSGIWSGVVIILILLMVSSFVILSMDRISNLSKTTATTLENKAELVSVARSVEGYWYYTGYWYYDNKMLSINLENWYSEPVTIVAIGILTKDSQTGEVEHIIIDKNNANEYNLELPKVIPTGSRFVSAIELENKPLTVTLGIMKGGTVPITLPLKNPVASATLKIVNANWIYYTDYNYSATPPDWIMLYGTGYIVIGDGYWAVNDSEAEIETSQTDLGDYLSILLWYNDTLSNYGSFYISTKVYSEDFSKGGYYSGIALIKNESTWPFESYEILALLTDGYYLSIEHYYLVRFVPLNVTWLFPDDEIYTPLPTPLNSTEWYTLVMNFTGSLVDGYLYRAGNPANNPDILPDRLLASIEYDTSRIGGFSPEYAGLIIVSNARTTSYFDEFLVSTNDPTRISIVNVTQPFGLIVTNYLNGKYIVVGQCITTLNETIEIPADPIVGVDGRASLFLYINGENIRVSSSDPVIGGSTYTLITESG